MYHKLFIIVIYYIQDRWGKITYSLRVNKGKSRYFFLQRPDIIYRRYINEKKIYSVRVEDCRYAMEDSFFKKPFCICLERVIYNESPKSGECLQTRTASKEFSLNEYNHN